jgi:hypothetical protein
MDGEVVDGVHRERINKWRLLAACLKSESHGMKKDGELGHGTGTEEHRHLIQVSKKIK